MSRRHALCCGTLAACGLFSSLIQADDDTGRRLAPPSPRPPMPAAARALIDTAFDGLDPTLLWDVHTHLLGTGDAGSGCWVNPQLDAWWHPLEAVRKRVILHGAGVAARSPRVDLDYV
jgi:uncharacterized protein